jgi:hypothetical protein
MPVIKQKMIYRSDLMENRDVLYVFGDNMQRVGLGGQARECRGEPNAVGIPTKWAPTMEERAFFKDSDLEVVGPVLDQELDRLVAHLDAGGVVVIPADGIGTGLSRLDQTAPRIFAYLQARLVALTGDR